MIAMRSEKHETGLTVLPLDKITIDPKLQKRPDGLDPNHLRDTIEALENGEKLEPVEVWQTSEGLLLLSDGFHRYAAAQALGLEAIDCKVFEGEFPDAEWAACAANQHKGSALKRDRRTVQQQIRSALLNPRSKGLSNAAIARHVGVTDKTVGEQRRRLEEKGLLAPLEAVTVSRQDGTCYELPVSRMPAKNSKASLEAAQALWAQVGTIRPARNGKKFAVNNDRYKSPFPIVFGTAQQAIDDWSWRGAKILDCALRQGLTPLKAGDWVEIVHHLDEELVGQSGTIVGIESAVELASRFLVQLDDNHGINIPCKPIDLKLAQQEKEAVDEEEAIGSSEPDEDCPEFNTGDFVMTSKGQGEVLSVGGVSLRVNVGGRTIVSLIKETDLVCRGDAPGGEETIEAELPQLQSAQPVPPQVQEPSPTQPAPTTPWNQQVLFSLNEKQAIGWIVKFVIETESGDRLTLSPDQISKFV